MIALGRGLHFGDHVALGLLFLGASLAIGVVALSHQREKAFSASVFYVMLGAIAALGLSLLGIAPLSPLGDHEVLHRASELALIVAVFSAGLTVERHVSRRSWVSIAILLAVVMPLSIATIALFASTVMGLSLGAAVLLGAVLAPTDPVLAGDVGLEAPGGEIVGEPRLSLHTEAGLNDGLASPFVVLGLFIAAQGGTHWLETWVAASLLYGVAVATAIGAAAGAATTRLLLTAIRRGYLSRELLGFTALALSLAVYGACEALGSYGLVGVFVAGYAFRRVEFDHTIHTRMHHGTHTAGIFLELLVLLLLGSMLTRAGLAVPGVAGWLLAPLIVFAIRPALVLATAGRFLPLKSRVFLGFFGVRGVAALFYAAIVAGSGSLSPHETSVVVWTTIACVVFSIVVHGTAATPLTARLLGDPVSPDR